MHFEKSTNCYRASLEQRIIYYPYKRNPIRNLTTVTYAFTWLGWYLLNKTNKYYKYSCFPCCENKIIKNHMIYRSMIIYLVNRRVTCSPFSPKLPTVACSWYFSLNTAIRVFKNEDLPQPGWPIIAMVRVFCALLTMSLRHSNSMFKSDSEYSIFSLSKSRSVPHRTRNK